MKVQQRFKDHLDIGRLLGTWFEAEPSVTIPELYREELQLHSKEGQKA